MRFLSKRHLIRGPLVPLGLRRSQTLTEGSEERQDVTAPRACGPDQASLGGA